MIKKIASSAVNFINCCCKFSKKKKYTYYTYMKMNYLKKN